MWYREMPQFEPATETGNVPRWPISLILSDQMRKYMNCRSGLEMHRFFALSIRTQLYIMAFIVALPAAGIIIYSGLDQRQNAIDEARTESKKLVDNIAAEQQALVASSKQLLSALAQLPEIKNGNRALAEPILADILGINPQFLNIFITDSHGLLLASAKPSDASISISDRRHFINARTNRQFSSGEYIIGRLLGEPTLSFGYPYKNRKGDFGGVIVVNLNLKFSKDILQRSKLPPGSSYALMDMKGVILRTGNNNSRFIGKTDSPDRFRRMENGPESGSYDGPGLDEPLRFLSYRKLRLDGEQTPYMYVRSGIPVNATIRKANQALFNNLALLTSCVMIAFFLVWLIAKRSIVDRIAILLAVSRRLAAGDLEARVPPFAIGGELGELGYAFNEMAIKLAREIAECKQTEEEIRQLQSGLEQRVRERTADLESFSYTVSHDLRAPLRHINSFSAVLIEDYGKDLPDEARGHLDRICSASSRIGALIDHILALSRVSRIDLKREAVDLSQLAVQVLAMYQDTDSQRRVEISIANSSPVLGDRHLLRQLLENLIGNAWKYTSKQPMARIEFGMTRVAAKETFFVRDDGVGFDMRYAKKLFAAFERLHGTEFEGDGIGLATSQRIVKSHGGSIWAEGRVGEGATFYFTLPATQSSDSHAGFACRTQKGKKSCDVQLPLWS